jgi:hypothetical protein
VDPRLTGRILLSSLRRERGKKMRQVGMPSPKMLGARTIYLSGFPF